MSGGSARVRWRFGVGGALTLGPVLAGDMLLVADAEGGLFALDAVSGRERWRNGHDSPTAGVAAGGTWVFAEDSGDLWPHDRATGAVDQNVFAGFSGRPVQVDGDVLLLQQDGVLRAVDLPTQTLLFNTKEVALEAPVAVGGAVMVAAGTFEGNSSGGGLRAFDAVTGRSLWSLESDEDENGENVLIPPFHPVAAHGRAWAATLRAPGWDDTDEESHRCELAGYDLNTGAPSFRQVVGPDLSEPCCAVAADGDLVFVATARAEDPVGYLTAFEAGPDVAGVALTAVDVVRGSVTWSRPLPDIPVGAPVAADGLVHILTRDGTVLACRAGTGETAWSFSADEPPGESVEVEWGEGVQEEPSRIAVGEGLVFVQTATQIIALEPPNA